MTETNNNKGQRRLVDLRPGMKEVNCTFIVLEKGGITKTKGDHTITHCVVADDSARINLSLWDKQGELLSSGDIIRLVGGYCTLYKNSLVLYSGCMHGKIERIGQYRMIFKEHPNMSGISWVTDPGTKAMVSPDLGK